MKKNLVLIVSLVGNVIFLIFLGFYLFSPYLDYAIVNKSLPRMCDFIEATQPDLNPRICSGSKTSESAATLESSQFGSVANEQSVNASSDLVFIDLGDPSGAEDVPQDVIKAAETLQQFFDVLRLAQYEEGELRNGYEKAASFYGGSYEQLQSWNPAVDPKNVTELWKNGCEVNGLQCLRVKSITRLSSEDPNFFPFDVEFYNKDGDIFTSEDNKTKFEFIIKKSDNGYAVMQMPIYAE